MRTSRDTPSLEQVLKELAKLPPVTKQQVRNLAAANRALDHDPAFLAEVQQASVANQLQTALEESGETQSSFARRWGKPRSYVSAFLGGKSKRYTIEAITRAAYHLGLRVTVTVHRSDEIAVVRPLATAPSTRPPRAHDA